MIRLLTYVLRLVLVVGVLLWLYASWVHEKPANVPEFKQTTVSLFSSAKSAALEIAKEELEKEVEGK